jgi:UDP-glucose 4-epimerase
MSASDSAPTTSARNVLVTGGAGFIGSNLVAALANQGHRVTVLDDLSTSTAENLIRRMGGAYVELIRGSVLDADLVDRWIKGADLVFHLAAMVGVARIVADPLESIRVNVDGTENVLAACARHGCQVVLASSSEIYGKSPDLPLREAGDRLLGPTSVSRWSYSTAKSLDEHLLGAYEERGLRGSIVRYFNCYGPGVAKTSDATVVGAFIRRALAGQPIRVHGDGSQRRCFTYVDDTVRATILAGTVPQAQGKAFNVGTTTETPIEDLAELVIKITGSRSPIEHVPHEIVYGDHFEDIGRRIPDITQAHAILGWEPNVSLEQGVEETIRWWQEPER